MLTKSANFVYMFAPDYLDNRFAAESQMFYVVLRSFNNSDIEYKNAFVEGAWKKYKKAEAHTFINKKSHDLIKTKILEIKNLVIEGFGPVTTMEQLFEQAPPAIFTQVCAAVGDAAKAWEGDIRNLGFETTSGFGTKEIKGVKSRYEYIPDNPANLERKPEDRIVIELNCLSSEEEENMSVFVTECADTLPTIRSQEVVQKKLMSLVKSKIVGIRNLTMTDSIEQDGKWVDVEIPILTGDDFFQHSSGSAIQTVLALVKSPDVLTRLEQKKL